MKFGLCQINPTVGDFAGNSDRILAAVREAAQAGAAVAVFSELALCGYPPEDLLLRSSFRRAHDRALDGLARRVPPEISVLLGCLAENEDAGSSGGRSLFNAVALLEGGQCRIVARKSLLPTYDVFDESRFFEPWSRPEENLVEIKGSRVGILICEDGWNDPAFFQARKYALDPIESLVGAGAEIIVNVSASPWRGGLERFRFEMIHASVERHGLSMLYVNQVGGNVALQFDGGSLAMGKEGLAFQPAYFEEAVRVVDTEEPWTVGLADISLPEMHHLALVQGISDYAVKFGFPKAVIGLSGGIDSALTAVLAVDALGAENVVGIAMPSQYSSEHSLEDARNLSENLGIELHELGIGSLQESFSEVLDPVFAGTEAGVAEENLQARARGSLLMAYANKFGHMLLTTGNKSECAVGYCTLYGDMCGALAVIADLWKTEVWALARWINRDGERIPQRSIEKPPSAELRPDQFDTDSLPPYEDLDPVLRCLVEEELSIRETSERTGMAESIVAEFYRKVMANEFKRYQYAPTLRVSGRCWGGRRVPVAHRFLDDGDGCGS